MAMNITMIMVNMVTTMAMDMAMKVVIETHDKRSIDLEEQLHAVPREQLSCNYTSVQLYICVNLHHKMFQCAWK